MASFLRRKSKQEAAPPKQPAVIISTPSPQTPLFARFATTAGSNEPGGTRMVSGPMVLSGNSVRREPSMGNRYASSSVSVASSREKERVQKPNGGPPTSIQQRAAVNGRQATEKPLPPGPTPPTSPSKVVSDAGRRSQQPPPVQLRPILRSNAQFVGDDKPLPPPAKPVVSNSIPRRKLSVQTAIPLPPPKPFVNDTGRDSPVITNLQDDEFDLTPRPSPSHVVHQDRNNGASTQRLSGPIDWPPEFALFQEFSATSSNSDSSRVITATTSTGARSGAPHPSTNTAPNTVASSSSQPLDMGNNTSVLSSPGLYPSPIQAFQGSRAFVGPSSNNTFSSVQTRPSFKRSVRSNSPPPPPGAAAPVVPGAPRIQDNDFQTSAPFPNFNATPGSVYQSAPPQVPTPPIVKGKPRIFAAMNAAAVDEPVYVEQSAANLPQLPPQPQPSPSQSYHQQYPERQSPGRSGSGNSNMFPSQPTAPAPFDSRMPYVSPATTPDVSVTSSYNNGQQPADVLRTPRVNNPRPLPQTPDKHVQSPPRVRKLSKVRQPSDVSTMLPNASSTSIMSASVESLHSNGHGHGPKVHTHNGHRTLAKSPPIPIRPGSSHNDLVRSASRSPSKHEQQPQPQLEQVPTHVDEETIRKAGIPLDDDPFAKVEGVRMLKPTSSPSKDGSIKRHRSKEAKANGEEGLLGKEDQQSELSLQSDVPLKKAKDSKDSSSVASGQTSEERRKERRERRAREKERKAKEQEAAAAAETEAAAQNTQTASSVNGEAMELDGEIEPVHGEELEALSKLEGQKFFLFKEFLSNPQLLSYLLSFMSFYDWCLLSAVSREIRIMLVQSTPLREEVLERFLKTVGYSRWAWEGKDPLSLSLQDLADYMRGVSTPSHEYARVAKMYVHSLTVHPTVRDSSLEHTVRRLTASTRAYTRVVLRLRAQAEKEASVASANPQRSQSTTSPPPSAANAAKAVNGYSNGYGNGHGAPSRSTSRPSSRAPSPTMSNYSHSHSQFSHSNSGTIHQNSSQTSLAFRSPLFRLRRAPLLRVFVPSPEGDWLSDKSVLDCEAECKKAGVLHLMRMGDVIWDIAAGDEGNVGRLVYDGKYLIDLDYTYNPIGDLPKYIHTLAFPPSYFHRVIRTGPVTSNPVAHIDISPWGEEIAANLQLLQDRVKTETPQGAYHNVVRWVHRSSFVIRPPARVMQRGQSINGRSQPHTPRIPIPETENLFIDPGWYGTIVVETEGTNETLADLQARCGPRAFPPRPKPLNPVVAKAAEENRKVFRILREKSRPGEIWIKAVSVKERIL